MASSHFGQSRKQNNNQESMEEEMYLVVARLQIVALLPMRLGRRASALSGIVPTAHVYWLVETASIFAYIQSTRSYC